MAEASPPPDNRCSMSTASDVMLDIVCNPCDSSGDTVEADGFCVECKQYLCTTCLKCHKNVNASKDHTLLAKDSMPSSQNASPATDVCTQPCQTHPNEVVKYFCPSHKVIGCDSCMTQVHDKCRRKVNIMDEAKRLADSKELKFVQTNLEELSKKSENVLHFLQTNINVSDDFRVTALEKIDSFRQEINDALDKVANKVEDISQQDTAVLAAAAGQTSNTKTELQQMSAAIKTLLYQNQHCQAFIEMKNAETKFANFQQQLEEAGSIGVTAFSFKPNEDLQKLLRENDAIGELLVKKMAEIDAVHVTDINVKAKGNKKACNISGSVLLSKDRLAIIDFENETVKLIDTGRQRVISEYKPGACPCDVTSINDKKVAITVPHAMKILLMDSDDKLKHDKDIHVDNKCWYIEYIDDKFVVGGDKPFAVRILSMTGRVLQTFSTSSTGEPLFQNPPRVTVNPLTQVIYTLDWERNRVLMQDMVGEVVAEYDDLNNPTYSALDDLGVMYVCSCNPSIIHVLTPGCNKVKTLLTVGDGLKGPCAISYCQATRRIYVGLGKNGNNTIKVFQLS